MTNMPGLAAATPSARTVAADPKAIRLSSTVTVAAYREMEDVQDRRAISQFIRQRFTERYVSALSTEKGRRNGFAIAALACLMIEALESFWHGWPDTKERGKGRKAFIGFFSRHSQFAPLAPVASEFYDHIRCGLLHQAETTGGWRIRRNGALFEPGILKVNAVKLMAGIELALHSYCGKLEEEPWDSVVWVNLRKKMDVLCKNAIGAQA